MPKQDYVSNETEANRIGPLDWGRWPIEISELVCAGELKLADIKVFIYLLHNENVHRNRTHPIDPRRVAEFTNMHVSSVYRSLGKLVKLGIIKERQSQLTFDMPILAASRATSKRKSAQNYEQRIQADIASEVKRIEKNGAKVTLTVRKRIEERIRREYAEGVRN